MHTTLTRFAFGAVILAAVPAAAVRDGEKPVAVTVTDEVLVEDVKRLGINLCADNYWDCAMLRKRAVENFEGVRYRMCTWGPQMDEHGIYVWFRPSRDPKVLAAMKNTVRYTILGGPDKGKTGLVKDIREQVCPADRQKRALCYIEFDREVQPLTQNRIGILLERDRPRQGSIRDTTNPAHWNSLGNTARIGDVPPGTFGCAALLLKGAAKPAHYAFGLMFREMGDQKGTWRVRLWAKAGTGEPTLSVQIGDTKTDVPVDGTWKHHDLNIRIDAEQRHRNLGARLIAAGGEVLVDDIEIWKEEPAGNPTVFRDIVVGPLRKLRPGILRYLQMGGSDLANNLRPRLKQMGWTRDFKNLLSGGRNDARYYRFNLHEFYVLCEHIGADPWYCLPGTVHPAEITPFMEYLGAPADTGYGKVRAELGHPKPWTEVFENIYVEMGNEAWNAAGYATGSYNGPEHWKDIFAAGKASPHYRKKILFVAGAQAGNPGVAKRVLANAPNADRLAVAPYIIHHLKKADVAPLDTDAKLFRWVFGFAARRVLHEHGCVRRNSACAREHNTELAVYEHNYHITKPSAKDGGAPIALRNRIIASLGGGITLVNDALLMLRELGVRSQCFFNLNQNQFREGVKLWGFMPGLNLAEPRYRPGFLATEIANHVLAGDLVETAHGADEPTFTARGIMVREWRTEPAFSDYGPLPAIRSYAFRKDTQRGMILFNFDTDDAHTVKLAFPGAAKDETARAWRLAADDIAAGNEYETGEPQVRIVEETLKDFAPGATLELPPHAMLVLKWESRD